MIETGRDFSIEAKILPSRNYLKRDILFICGLLNWWMETVVSPMADPQSEQASP